MQKIALLIDNLGSGGAQRQILNLSILLKDTYKVEIIIYQDIIFYKNEVEDNDIKVVVIDANSYLKRLISVRHYLRHNNYAIIISFLETPNFLACFANLGIRKFGVITSERSAKESTFIGLKNKIYNFFDRYADIKICNSYKAKENWMKYKTLYKNKAKVIYNPIIISNSFLKRNSKNTCRKLVVAASYQPLKNILRVIEAVNLLDDQQKKLIKIDWYGRSEIVRGDNKLYLEAKNKLDEYNLTTIFSLHDETTNIHEKMNDSDAVGLFSIVEGLPNSICEGMMLRKPILMSKVSDYEMFAKDNAFLCDPLDIRSIKNCLVEFIKTPSDELYKMGQMSYAIAQNLFDPNIIRENWIKEIENVIKGKRKI